MDMDINKTLMRGKMRKDEYLSDKYVIAAHFFITKLY